MAWWRTDPAGQPHLRRRSGGLPGQQRGGRLRPGEGQAELDALGWKQDGEFRPRTAKQLVIRDVLYDAQSARQVAQVAQNTLAQIGVKLELDVKPANGFFTNYVNVGDFDITQFSWVATPSRCAASTRYSPPGPRATSARSLPAIDAKVDEVLDELDETKARALANEVDAMLWDEVFSLALFQSPGNVAVRSDLANFGPPAWAT